jgi:hypothetical protein
VPVIAISRAPIPLVTRLPSPQLPGLSTEGAWFFADNNLWRVPYSGGQPHLVAPGLAGGALRGEPRPAPDGQKVAFACGSDPCLMALPGGQGDGMANVQRATALEPAEVACSPAGSLLAIVDRSANQAAPVRLAVVGRDAKVVLQVEIAPSDVTEAPHWTPDGGDVFVQTYPT